MERASAIASVHPRDAAPALARARTRRRPDTRLLASAAHSFARLLAARHARGKTGATREVDKRDPFELHIPHTTTTYYLYLSCTSPPLLLALPAPASPHALPAAGEATASAAAAAASL